MAIAPVLTGERVTLRPVTLDDLGPQYVSWLNDPDVNRFIESRHITTTEDMLRAFITKVTATKNDYLCAICIEDGARHIGNVRLGPVREEHRLAEISFYIGDPTALGKGYGSETVGLISGFGFNELGLNKLMGRIYAANEASIRAFQSAGWKQEARLEDHYLFEGQPMDLIFVGCTIRNYTARAQALHTTK